MEERKLLTANPAAARPCWEGPDNSGCLAHFRTTNGAEAMVQNGTLGPLEAAQKAIIRSRFGFFSPGRSVCFGFRGEPWGPQYPLGTMRGN